MKKKVKSQENKYLGILICNQYEVIIEKNNKKLAIFKTLWTMEMVIYKKNYQSSFLCFKMHAKRSSLCGLPYNI